MSAVNQVPRSSLIWLLLAQFVVIVPHMGRLSWWMIAIWGLCAIWRFAMYRGQASYPGVFLRVILVTMGCVGIALDFGSLGGLDVAVALLILAFSLKLIEVRERRDLFLVIFLAYFIIAAAFLFSQSMLLALYQMACVIVVTAALTAMQDTRETQSYTRPLKSASLLLAQAVPLMIVFFIVFPRLGPLWAVPISEAAGSTGMGDQMSPGDIADLSRSSELAFRVEFESPIPARDQLYWRAMTLSYFDGRSWSANNGKAREADSSEQRSSWQRRPMSRATSLRVVGEPVSYSVSMEPGKGDWLYALPYATFRGVEGKVSSGARVIPTNDFSLRYSEKLYTKTTFRFDSYLDFQAEKVMPGFRYQQETRLPAGVNPQTRELVHSWYGQADSDRAYIDKVLAWFNQQEFYYTLQPPLLGQNSIDQFLFDTRAGFCEHYASAFTFMMRSAGIPARVVLGYQGGEENPYDNSLTVRQFDAHAWSEVWLAGEGWVRFDPTAAVAPERVQSGLEDALTNRQEFLASSLFSPLRYRDVAWLSWARLRLEAINHNWQKWVINFNTERQIEVLTGLLGKITAPRMGTLVLLALALVLGLVGLSLLRHRVSPSLPPATQAYLRFCERLEKYGVQRAPGEAPGQFARRVASEYPQMATAVGEITGQYESIVYCDDEKPGALRSLKRAVARFRPRK